MQTKEPLLISVQEAAELLRMNPRQVRECIENHTFPFGVCMISAAGKKIYKISRRRLMDFIGG